MPVSTAQITISSRPEPNRIMWEGKFIYRAWWEILPAAETIISSITVKPGDTMTGLVWDVLGSTWVISLKDVSTGQAFTTVQKYTGPGGSAE